MPEEKRICQNCGSQFAIEPQDFRFYEKINVPPPTWCPRCRLIRRFIHKNYRNLYRVKDAANGKEIFSSIPPQAPVKVYDHDYWWSDAWDPMEYGADYDFSKPFLVQIKELMQKVPFPSRNIMNLVNSDYADQGSDLKDSYLCFNCSRVENSAYITNAASVKDSYDLYDAGGVELCYDSLTIGSAHKNFFSMHCGGSNNLWFCRDCSGCSNCFGCANLRIKQYHIFNQPYAKEEYFNRIKDFHLDSYVAFERVRARANDFWEASPYKYIHGSHNSNVSGDYINFSKNVQFSFGIEGGEDLKYCQEVYQQKGGWEGGKDSYDYYNFGYGSELIYESVGVGQGCRKVKFCLDCLPANQELEYCLRCVSSRDLFGCVGLRKKSYCILNKQYSREDFFKLREKIIAQMNEMPFVDSRGKTYGYGEFFPAELSLFGYNETIAQDYYPLTEEEARKRGYAWREIERREHKTTLAAENLPDSIADTNDSIVEEIIGCLSCKKPYRIIRNEFLFLKSQSIPLPRLCPECRHQRRFSYRNRPESYGRKCQCIGQNSENGAYRNITQHFHGSSRCPNEFQTSYAPEKDKIIYCEQCYQAETA